MKSTVVAVSLMLALMSVCHASEKAVSQVLDALHTHAAQANAEHYFALFRDDATFIGTDAREVWNINEFKAYAMPHFSKGEGWTYHPYQRHITLSADNQTAWFDELLRNNKLGITRGSGVLIKQGERWKIAQYHLAIPVPNAIASEVTNTIKAHSKKGGN